ncbi:hypothetical protein [Hydrocarboniclastica marina]|uniref:Uncharacterized protein n=1 Tax=Hydrocarboniclastica marina TaxID=2259620 RepID=A0A4P7XEA6_9ALTE|nr:hypothetical protein [Hydrocarboniclastica marina]MAL99814.1 hypothetical protein [Alteromonadaceae bacterium]QCF25221.1 hypothetical protein soil367_04345 [Hydrocarboniclastica marina]
MMEQQMTGTGLLGMLITGIILVVPFWKICKKAGYPAPLSLLVLIPLVNLGLFYFLAFADWPVFRSQEIARAEK